jgi:hypothetical protein
MENWVIKVEPEDGEQANNGTENASKKSDFLQENETMEFESVMIKEEPREESVYATENPDDEADNQTSCINTDERPVKQEDEEQQSDPVICGLPAPETEISDHEQPHNIGNLRKYFFSSS